MSDFHVVGLSGVARAGKDTVGNILADHLGFRIFSFSDALYEEVGDAFEVSEVWLKDDANKDTPQERMALKNCSDENFVEVAIAKLDAEHKALAVSLLLYPIGIPLTPRWILQTWGTEYRRAENPDYWVERAADKLQFFRGRGIVNVSVRFPNEYWWIKSLGGDLWRVDRPDAESAAGNHASEFALRSFPYDIVVHNDGGLEDLRAQVQTLAAARELYR